MQGRRQGGLGVLKHPQNLLVTHEKIWSFFVMHQSVNLLPHCIIFFRGSKISRGVLRPQTPYMECHINITVMKTVTLQG